LLCYLQILRQFLISYQSDNSLGLLIQKTDAKNQTSVYTYDNAGRMTQIVQTDAASNTKTIGFTYDDAGNLLTYNDGTTSASYTYDNLYRKTQETTNYGAFSLTTSYSYNKTERRRPLRTRTAPPSNTPMTPTISRRASTFPARAVWPTININGHAASVTLPDGGTSQYAYDELMRTKAITAKDYAANRR